MGGEFKKMTCDYSYILISAALMTTKSVEALGRIKDK